MKAIVLTLASVLMLAATGMEYVTHEPPAFEDCMAGCDASADACLAPDDLDDLAITVCEETKLTCYRRCAAREAMWTRRCRGT